MVGSTGGGGGGGAGGAPISNSLRLRGIPAGAYLASRALTTSTDNRKRTFSFWIKRALVTGPAQQFWQADRASSTEPDYFYIKADGAVEFYARNSGLTITTSMKITDPTAWAHIVLSFDSTVAGPNLKIWVNGKLGASGTLSANSTSILMDPIRGQYFGVYVNSPYNQYLSNFDGFLAEAYGIDGLGLDASYFGQTDSNGVWVPKVYSGSYGANGYHLEFKETGITAGSNTGLGKDTSGNGNYWNTQGISATAGVTYDAMVDTPTNNYATLNPLDKASCTTSDANLSATYTTYTNWVRGTVGMSSGKWYWEIVGTTGGTSLFSGVATNGASNTTDPATLSTVWGYYGYSGNKFNGSGSAYGTTYTDNDIIGIAVDMDSGKVWWSKNGTWHASGDPAAGTNAAFTNLTGGITVFPMVGNNGSTTWIQKANFGQRPFAYTPPTGFKALCTANLPAVAITKPMAHFYAAGYTGSDAQGGRGGTGVAPHGNFGSPSGGEGGGASGVYRIATNQVLTSNPDRTRVTHLVVGAGGGGAASPGVSEGGPSSTGGAGGTGNGAGGNGNAGTAGGTKEYGSGGGGAGASGGTLAPGAGGQNIATGTNTTITSGSGSTVANSGDTNYVSATGNGGAAPAPIGSFTGTPSYNAGQNGALWMQMPAGSGSDTTYTTPGIYEFIVPEGVTSIRVKAWGAGAQSGCAAYLGGGAGGGGGFAQGDIAVTPGELLHYSVGAGGEGTQAQTHKIWTSFQPDLAWVKSRTAATDHVLTDSVRGVNKSWSTNLTAIENATSNEITSFVSNGFTVSAATGARTNSSFQDYISWSWKANGAGTSNTNGSITSTVSANTTAGFSIVTYAGSPSAGTVGHGLGVAPSLILAFNRTLADNRPVYHVSRPSAYLFLQSNAAEVTSNTHLLWGNGTIVVAPTTSVFSVGTATNINTSGNNYVAYCFAAVPGYSKFGSFNGTNTVDGTFVHCGFKPRWIMVKSASAGGTSSYDWAIIDTVRGTSSTIGLDLMPNTTATEFTSSRVEVVSNGFKLRDNTSNHWNGPNTYIYAAFAEHPFGGSNVAPATAATAR